MLTEFRTGVLATELNENAQSIIPADVVVFIKFADEDVGGMKS